MNPCCVPSVLLGSLVAASLLAAVSCGDDSSTGSGSASGVGATGGSAGSTGTGGSAGGSGSDAGQGGDDAGPDDAGSDTQTDVAEESDAKPLMRQTVLGDATWTVTFDDVAKGAGATDCTYTRHYVGFEEASRPWVCPVCDIVFHATVDMTSGEDDCFAHVSDTAYFKEEWFGYGQGKWWRGYGGTAYELGTATVTQDTITFEHVTEPQEATVIGAGTMSFHIVGALAVGQEEGDPMNGWHTADSYACGWARAAPPEYAGNYTVAKGATVPDGLFLDKCDEVVRLHDQGGAYLVINVSAGDCPVCKSMAAGETQFVNDLAAAGIQVHTVTLLAPSLDDPWGNTSKAQLTAWTTAYHLESPVLADRGWGEAVVLTLFGEEAGYPSWVVTDPKLQVLDFGTGSDWPGIKATILADAQR